MKVLHLLLTGHVGGIEVLCKDIAIKSDWDNILCFLWEGGRIANDAKRHGANVIILEEKKKNIFSTFNKIVKIIKNEKVDVVNIHYASPFLHFYLNLIKFFLPKTKIVLTIHSCYEKSRYLNGNLMKNVVLKNLYRRALINSDLIITVSKAVKNSILREFVLNENKIEVVYNGVDYKRFNAVNELTNKNDKLKIMYIGRLVKIKGVDILIKSFCEVNKYINNIELIIIGDGIEKNNLEKIARESSNENIIFTGAISCVEDYLKSCNIFVYPSICEEAFGISIIEAMNYGIPCITFGKGGIPEIITDEINGFICKDISVNSLAEKISKVINMIENDEIDLIYKNAKETALKFSLDTTISNLKKSYESVL